MSKSIKVESQYVPQTSTPLRLPISYLDQMTYATSTPEQKTTRDDNLIKGTRFLSTKAVSMLNHWFQENRDYPYPDENTTDYLAKQADISAKQVKKWFANKRVRSQMCCKSMNRNKRKFLNDNENHVKTESFKQEPKYTENQQFHTSNMSYQLNSSTKNKMNWSSQQRRQCTNQNLLEYSDKASNSSSSSSSSPGSIVTMPSRPYMGHQTPLNDTMIQKYLKTQMEHQSRGNYIPVQQNPFQFSNALMLRSMSYFNPMLMMNIIAQSNLQNSQNSKAATNNFPQYSKGDENENNIDENQCRSSTSRSSTSSQNDNEIQNEIEEKINISTDSYESYEAEGEQVKSEFEENYELSDKKADSTTSTASNYAYNNNSLINSNLSPCSTSSSSYASSSFTDNLTISKKSKINFADIATLID